MPYLIFDLEMSGDDAIENDIIEIGCMLADDDWNKISTFESLIYPDNEDTFSTQAEEIHGISLQDLEDAPMSFDVLEAFEQWLRKALRKNSGEALTNIILCGQGVGNDANFLRQKYNFLNIPWPFSYRMLDLLTLTTLFYKIFDNNSIKRPKSYSLSAISEFFELERKDDTHNALEDAELTYQCFKKFFEIGATIKISDFSKS